MYKYFQILLHYLNIAEQFQGFLDSESHNDADCEYYMRRSACGLRCKRTDKLVEGPHWSRHQSLDSRLPGGSDTKSSGRRDSRLGDWRPRDSRPGGAATGIIVRRRGPRLLVVEDAEEPYLGNIGIQTCHFSSARLGNRRADWNKRRLLRCGNAVRGHTGFAFNIRFGTSTRRRCRPDGWHRNRPDRSFGDQYIRCIDLDRERRNRLIRRQTWHRGLAPRLAYGLGIIRNSKSAPTA